jgi:hypothetical protein
VTMLGIFTFIRISTIHFLGLRVKQH